LSGLKMIRHTADIGFHVTGDTIEELFEKSAEGMTELLTGFPLVNLDETPEEIKNITVEGADYEDLLFSFLSELLYLYEVENFVVTGFSGSSLEENGNAQNKKFSTEAAGRIPGAEKYPGGEGIKAVTYHGMNIRYIDGYWRTDIIFDV
jgi:SHS2 domain-containing protein